MKHQTVLIIVLLAAVLTWTSCQKSTSTTEPGDTTPPVVSISTPLHNSTVTDSIVIAVSVSDNVRIEKVEFYINGSLIHTRSVLPWEYKWDVRRLPLNSTHTIHVKAYDASNNVGSSQSITVAINRTVQTLQFNGVSDFVRLPSSPSLTSFGTQITIEAWIKINAYGGVVIASGNENEYSFAVRPDGRLSVTMARVNPQVNAEFIGKSILTLNTWYHVAFTYNGSAESILINGIIDTSFVATGNISTAQYTENISIGTYSWNNHTQHSSFFNGLIDDLRVWNIGRTQAQIQADLHIELSGSEQGIVGYWTMNGNVADKSTNANNGTLGGNPTFVTTTR